MRFDKKTRIAGGIVVGVALVLGILWYYQQQGFVKIFPTREDREIKRLLTIDETKFKPASGLSEEKFKDEIKELYRRRDEVKKNPQSPAAWFNFGYTLEFLNDHGQAVKVWEKALELQPLNFVTAFNLANTYQYFLKDYPKAEIYYRKALEVNAGYTSAYQGLMDLYRFNLKEKESLYEPLVLEAVKKDAANELTYYSNLVEFFASKNDLPKARKYLAEVRRIKPEQAQELVGVYPQLR